MRGGRKPGLDWVFRLLGAGGLAIAGWQVTLLLPASISNPGRYPSWGLVLILAGALVGALAGPYLTIRPLNRLLATLDQIPSSRLIAGTAGLLVGLVVASLVSIPFFRLHGWLSWGVPSMISGFLGLVGLTLGVQRERELHGVLPATAREARASQPSNGRILVDTSAIIDGRIADLTKTRFIEGTLVVPRFVLDELRHIADSSDFQRRARGRRGLEVLGKLRQDNHIPIKILDVQVRNGTEVDAELVRLAKGMKARILTTDFNLNRVAELQGVQVLNVNELAHALKPVLLPGEELAVNIVQEGKEIGQGVGYLDDGTMVVVEGGRRFINTVHDVTVIRVLQTAAGRIIFAQPRGRY